ncbi:hypothetical protein C8N46_11433 [Kordia periserrulae]|uniref:Uncharacterized protein n=1 Tax=Kordia periserrulae TaxID=701523 RepID=A0A2T6BQP3_9FLAO|nr:hypothetical protein [Kordia periserrulae]PTX58388.1 hypothetical protein C8N46_11433 [Kordia periserrulae]
MNTFLIIIGILILFYILHRILMNWQINKSIDYFIENAETVTKTPEMIEKEEILKNRIEDLKKKNYHNELDLLYDLSSVYILEMLKDESGWTLNKNDFRIKRVNETELKTRLKISHFSGNERVYQINYTQGLQKFTDINNYKVGMKMLDIFCQELDTFYK